MDINELRNHLDIIDDKISALFEERMMLVKKIAEYKIKNNLPIEDTSREEEIIQKGSKRIKNQEYTKYYVSLMETVMSISKDYQKTIID